MKCLHYCTDGLVRDKRPGVGQYRARLAGEGGREGGRRRGKRRGRGGGGQEGRSVLGRCEFGKGSCAQGTSMPCMYVTSTTPSVPLPRLYYITALCTKLYDVQYHTVLYGTTLHCTCLYNYVLYCTALHYTAGVFIILYCTV